MTEYTVIAGCFTKCVLNLKNNSNSFLLNDLFDIVRSCIKKKKNLKCKTFTDLLVNFAKEDATSSSEVKLLTLADQRLFLVEQHQTPSGSS